MKAELCPKIPGPFSNVLLNDLIDVPASGAEHSNKVSGPVISRAVDFPIPIALFQSAPQ